MNKTRFTNPVSANPTPGSPMTPSVSGESLKGGVDPKATSGLDHTRVKDESLERNRTQNERGLGSTGDVTGSNERGERSANSGRAGEGWSSGENRVDKSGWNQGSKDIGKKMDSSRETGTKESETWGKNDRGRKAS